MDLLTDIFRQAGLRRRLLDQRHLRDATALQFPCERSMGLHVVTAGQVYLHSTSLPQSMCLQAGDVAVMAPDEALQNALISGAYQFWHTPVHPFFAEMPDWLELLQQELALQEQGRETLVYGLLDVVFVLLMREMLQRQGERTSCWSHGIQDPW